MVIFLPTRLIGQGGEKAHVESFFFYLIYHFCYLEKNPYVILNLRSFIFSFKIYAECPGGGLPSRSSWLQFLANWSESFLCSVCMFSQCLHGLLLGVQFPPQSKDMYIMSIIDAKLAFGVNVFVSLPALHWTGDLSRVFTRRPS